MSKWKLLTLRDICQATQGVQIPKNKQINTEKKGFKRYFYISDFTHDKKTKYVENKYPKKNFTAKDLIVSNTGSHGEIFRGKEGILSNNLFKVTIDEKVVNDNFLVYFLKSNLFKNFQSKRVRGTANPHMGHKNFLDTPINLPPLSEQQQIVAKLDTAFAEIEKEINASKNKQKIVDSLKKNILTKKFELDSDVIKLGDLCEVITKGTTPTSLGYKFIDKGINFIKIESINDIGNFIKNKFAYINKDCNAALKRSQLQAGDILFSIAGALGRTAIVTEEILPANTNQALAILRIKKDIKVDKKFLLHCLNSDVVKKQSDTFKGGTAQQNISLSQLKSYNIPLPSLVEQKDIVTKLDLIFTEINKFKNLIEMKIKNYQKLSYTIFKKELQKETA